MQRDRFCSTLLTLACVVVIGQATAQQPGPAAQSTQPAQQAQQPQPPGQPPQAQPLLVVPSMAPPPAPAARRLDPDLPTVELLPLLQRVERESGKTFLADARLGPRIYLGGMDANDVTYPALLSILRANGFAAFESEGRVNIVPDAEIRFYAPVMPSDDASVPADLYVTRVLTTENVETAYLVPILRPLMPQTAHLAAHVSRHQLIVMDRYENVQRIAAIVRTLDVPGGPPIRE